MSSNVTGTPGPVPPQLPGYVKPPKSPGLAVLLSLFPGLGQVYNGQPAKALVFFAAWAASVYAVREIAPLPFGLFIPFVYFFNLVDAYRSAASVNARFLGGTQAPEEDTAESPVWGGTLVAIGMMLLLHNLGWLRFTWLRQYWPLLLIVLGLILLRNSMGKRKGTEAGDGRRA